MIVPKGCLKIRKETGWVDAISDGRVEELYTKHLPLTNVINENAGEILFASKKTDEVDGGSLFYSKEPEFRRWCLDLFDHYWNNVQKVNSVKFQEV
jgi:predicted transcriptional regulator